MTERLVVDLGGTNFRIGLFNTVTHTLSHVHELRTAELSGVEQGLKLFFDMVGAVPKTASFAVACPTHNDCISLTNLNWSFSRAALQEAFQFDRLDILNDFAAVAQSVVHLQPHEKFQIGGKEPLPGYPLSVCGPGTGLGVAHLIPQNNGQWHAMSGEGGHVDFPAVNALEDEILQLLRRRFDRVSAERLLCGSGLSNLHMARMQIEKGVAATFAPHIITQAALEGDADCEKSFNLFCGMLGRFAGNLALTFGSFGGVYLSGGILPRYLNFIKNSPFRQEFENKGRLSYFIRDIPVYVVTHENPGLLGAGYHSNMKYK